MGKEEITAKLLLVDLKTNDIKYIKKLHTNYKNEVDAVSLTDHRSESLTKHYTKDNFKDLSEKDLQAVRNLFPNDRVILAY